MLQVNRSSSLVEQQQQEKLQWNRKLSSEELKERIKQAKLLSSMSKEETLKLRLQHVG